MKEDKEDCNGYVYIMTNYIHPTLVKIGQTTKKPDVRANELTKSTGVLGEFIVEWFAEVPNCKLGESLAHNLFSKNRVQKEFFKLDVNTAIISITEILEKIFPNEKIACHIPPKPISKSENKKLIDLEITLFDNDLFTPISELDYTKKSEEIKNLRWKLLYCPEKYFEDIFNELEFTCTQGITIEDIKKYENKGLTSWGYIYIPLNNSFNKWFFNHNDTFVKRPIYEEGYIEKAIFDEEDEKNMIAFTIGIPYTNYELKSKYADLFIKILRKNGISCTYKIEETNQQTQQTQQKLFNNR